MDPQNIDDIISTLPTENGWLSDDNRLLYYYQGFWYHKVWLRGAIAAQAELQSGRFNLSPTDIILACNPKCGTTWLKALSFAIATRTRFTQDMNPIRFTNPHDLIGFLEVSSSRNLEGEDPKPPLVSTHLPYTHLPRPILASECKIVYIFRDPKDKFISDLHFFHKLRSNKDVTEPIPLEEAFELFCRGVSSFGPYWDHVLGYWKAFLDHPDKVLFLKYEDMMGNIEEHVIKLAEFMGYPFSIEEVKEGAVARIVKLCSFESLSNLSVNKGGELVLKGSASVIKDSVSITKASVSITKDSYFRKAKVGDWKNYLTEEMANKIDQITMDKLGAFGLSL